ncbi:MAG: 2-oxo acid dehydrogenase subunit E2 [Anaerolineae bacterium]|nr:2-oxo acid dehydrogenase subunit E2 [Anaerolineae bacterium]
MDVILPNLGFGMEEGRVVSWFKSAGDAVRKGEPLVEIEGDKSTVELEALADGVLEEILVPGDTVVEVGSVLARIRRAGSSPAEPAAASPAAAVTAPVATETVEEAQQVSPVARRLAKERGVDLASVSGSGRGGRITREDVEAALSQQNGSSGGKVLAAPAVRKLAWDNGLDLSTIVGSGSGGRVTRADVEAALSAPKAAPVAPSPAPTAAPVETPAPAAAVSTPAPAMPVYEGEREEVSLSQMRKAIARRLTQSMQDMPHFYVTAELDFTDALKVLPQGIGINNLVLYLTVKALQDMPDLNATYEENHLYHYPHINLAIAVALPNGLITPVLHGADDFSLSGLSNRARDLVKRARDGRLRPEEMQGGTFTVSNLGIINQIDQFTAIINPPQVAILAIGAVKERPVVLNGGLHIRTTAHLTLSADHRIVDGLVSAHFIEAFDKHLQAFNG